jgi:hypothetical protein
VYTAVFPGTQRVQQLEKKQVMPLQVSHIEFCCLLIEAFLRQKIITNSPDEVYVLGLSIF